MKCALRSPEFFLRGPIERRAKFLYTLRQSQRRPRRRVKRDHLGFRIVKVNKFEARQGGFIMPNKPTIEKCVLSFSHNRAESRAAADRQSIAKAQREIAAGKSGVSHLILRAADDEIDRLKFLFPIHGVPIMCYALANLLRSSLKEIVVVGSWEVKRVMDRYLELIGSAGKSVKFVPEDMDNLSLANTMLLGRDRLSLDADEMVLFQPGDLPFLYDVEKVLRDEDIPGHNLILWLNSRQAMFPGYEENPESEFVRRNYHYRYLDEASGILHDVKEPNIYPINLARVEEDVIELLHHTRKDGKISTAILKKALTVPLRFFRLLPLLGKHAANFSSDLQRLRGEDDYQFGMHRDNFNEGASILLNTAFTSKVHDDPAFVSDVDALEDWEDFESLTLYAAGLHGEEGLSRIHPAGDDLTKFKLEGMPGLEKELPMYKNFPAYLNRIYKDLEMGYEPFDAAGNYAKPDAADGATEQAYNWYSQTSQRRRGAGASESRRGAGTSERNLYEERTGQR